MLHPSRSHGSSARAGCGFDTSALEQYQIGGTVAAGDTGFMTGADFVPIVACFGAAGTACVVYSSVFTLSGDTCSIRLPEHRDPLSLTRSTVGNE